MPNVKASILPADGLVFKELSSSSGDDRLWQEKQTRLRF